MPYRLRRNESVSDALRRIAAEQIDKAISEIDDDSLVPHETVHQVRKRCKKLRGLLRLVRPGMEGDSYRQENAWFRDSARDISALRDAQTLVDTYDKLMDRFAKDVQPTRFKGIRRTLRLRRRELAAEGWGLDEHLRNFRRRMREARERVSDWRIDNDRIAAPLSGLRKTYKRGRKAMEAASEAPTDESLHEWRKRAKYHWYHMRLVKSAWKPMLKAHGQELDRLGDLLGYDHDLAVLRQTVGHWEADARPDIPAFLELIDRRRQELQKDAYALGARLFAEKPSCVTGRLRHYWQAWLAKRKLKSVRRQARSKTA